MLATRTLVAPQNLQGSLCFHELRTLLSLLEIYLHPSSKVLLILQNSVLTHVTLSVGKR